MNCIEFAEKLHLTPLCEKDGEIEIEGVYIGDLLSIVMSKAKKNYAWITIQTHINIVAVAELLELACIIEMCIRDRYMSAEKLMLQIILIYSEG